MGADDAPSFLSAQRTTLNAAGTAFGHVVAKAMVEGQSSRTPSTVKAAPRPRAASSGSKEVKGNVVSMEKRRGEALEASMTDFVAFNLDSFYYDVTDFIVRN